MSNETMTTNSTAMPGSEVKIDVQNVGQREATNPTVQADTPRGEASRFTLFRHPTDKMIGGVCGGLGDYLNWDPTLIRILWVAATITTGGGGLLAYLALWLLLPVGTAKRGQVRSAAVELTELNLGRAAKVLIVLGGLLLLSNVGILPSLWSGFWFVMRLFFWPALLIGIGYLLLRSTGQTLDWRVDLGNWRNRMRMNEGQINMPDKEALKSNFQSLRQRFPLKRSRRNKMFMGVCGGIGQKLGVDANLVRLVWAALSIGSIGAGVLLYVFLGLVLPEETPVLAPNGYDTPDTPEAQIIDGTATYKV